MIDGNLKNLPDGWPKNLLSFLKDYALAPINRGIDASIDGYHTIGKGMLNDLVDGCDPENPLQPEEEEDSPDANSNDQQDPSGYVYEAVTSNRLPGVAASIYKKEVTTDMYGDKTETAVFWDAERYMQQNPQTTDDMGKYGWDVPQGEWQVRFSKPGYEPEETAWLPVPPPQLDVNIGVRHAVTPKVEGAVGRESGITVTFDKYMKPETFADTTLSVSRGEGSVEGRIEMVNLESEPVGGHSYASKVKFRPRKQFTSGETVMLRVAHGCMSYADMPLADDVVLPVVILPDIHEIATDPAEVRVFIGENRTVDVTVSPETASAGHLLKIVNASPLLATVGTESVRLDGNGQASFSVRGEMPGVAQLQLSVEGYDLTAELPVDVLWKVGKVANPVASISSESAVAVGTPVALKCSTAGSHIYYTTDGSDPADESNPSRLLYKTPLIVDRTVTIKAVGMMEGVDRSDVVEFRYSTVITGVSGPVAPSADVVVENGAIVVRNCNATSCEIFNAAGIKIWSRTDLYGEVRVPVTGGPVFIVRTVGPDGHVSATTVIVN